MITKNKNETVNQRTVTNLGMTISIPPVIINQEYIEQCKSAASSMGVDTSAIKTDVINSDSISQRNEAFAARNAVFDVANEIDNSTSRADIAGVTLEQNPLIAIATVGISSDNDKLVTGKIKQDVNIDSDIADKTIAKLSDQLAFLTTENISNSGPADVAQIGHIGVSLDGYGTEKSTAVDLMKFVPTIVEVAKQKENDQQAALDFKLRTPRILFVIEHDMLGSNPGLIVGWKKIDGAAGYNIRRRRVFDGQEKIAKLSNDDLTKVFNSYYDYIKSYVLTFYDSVDETNVSIYFDNDIAEDQYYLYSIQTYQIRSHIDDKIFNVGLNTKSLTLSEKARITDLLTMKINKTLMGLTLDSAGTRSGGGSSG